MTTRKNSLVLCMIAIGFSFSSLAESRYEFSIPVEMSAAEDDSGREWREFFANANVTLKDKMHPNAKIDFYENYKNIGVSRDEGWKLGAWSVSFGGGVKLTSDDFPKSNKGTKIFGGMTGLGYEITNVDFLDGVEVLNYGIDLSHSSLTPLGKITNLRGLRNLRSSTRDIMFLNGNNLMSLDGLQKLEVVRGLYVFNNPKLTDISAIENLAGHGLVALDDISQYKKRPRKGSAFCNSIRNGKLYAKVRKDTKRGYIDSPFLTEEQICM